MWRRVYAALLTPEPFCDSGHASPASVEAHMEAQLVSCVEESLSLFLLPNATFLAERLVAAFPTEACARARMHGVAALRLD